MPGGFVISFPHFCNLLYVEKNPHNQEWIALCWECFWNVWIQLEIAGDSMCPKRTNCMFDRLHGLLRRATKPTRCLYKPDTSAKFQRYHWKARFTVTLTRSAPRKALFKKPALLQGSVLHFVANVCRQRMNVGVQVQILCFSPLSALIFGGFAATIRLWDRRCTNAQLKHILDTVYKIRRWVRLQPPSLQAISAELA